MAELAGRFRAREVLEKQILALRQRTDATGGGLGEFDRGAGAALSWLLAGEAAPLTGADTEQSPPAAAAVVHELAAVENLIYQRRSARRKFARGSSTLSCGPSTPARRRPCPPLDLRLAQR